MNDWQPCCVNALSGQGGDNKKARVRVSDNFFDCDWQPWCANGHRRRTVANIYRINCLWFATNVHIKYALFGWERGWSEQDWNDWKHWCANGMLGQDGHIKTARVRVSIA